MYCLCSNKSFDEIIEKQANARLPLNEFFQTFTSCTTTGCGSCVELLTAELADNDLLIHNAE
ncbi:MAG: hypothetical protein B0W54_17310 [Cellvibrio sp. 79]|nr:MAG: hypothetical protein B0W54_17310 [Cellvibrio sp. 79]